jgi:adenylate kinase family enzyme
MARCSAFQADGIVIIGCAGSGKSTLAASLAARLGAPHVRRDDLGPEGSDQYRTAAAATRSANEWIFDGAPYYVEDLVYRRAGLVVGFDLPRLVVMQRFTSRSLRESLSWTPAPPHCDRR